MIITSSHRYSIDSLLPVFQAALDQKLANASSLAGSWQTTWPGNNPADAQLVVDFLTGAKANAATEVVTCHPLSDAAIHGHNPCANFSHTLFMQIRANMIRPA